MKYESIKVNSDFMKFYDSLEKLNEGLKYKEEDILSDQEVKEIKDKLAKLEPEEERLRKLYDDKAKIAGYKFGDYNGSHKLTPAYKTTQEYKEYQKAYEDGRKLFKEASALRNKLRDHEAALRYKNAGEGLATEEDGEEILYTGEDVEVEDLEVEVWSEEGEYPSGGDPRTDSILYTRVPSKKGYITTWAVSVDVTKEHVADFLGKKVEEITTRDLMELDETEFATYLSELDEVIAQAEKEAAENYEYDDVDWLDWDDYEPDYEY